MFAGDTQQIIRVFELPPSESCSMRVSLESRYGTNTLPRFWSSPSALITLPSASRPLLISIPSFIVLPCAPVRFARSLPAKSTKWNLLLRTSACPLRLEEELGSIDDCLTDASSSPPSSCRDCDIGAVCTGSEWMVCSMVMVKMAWDLDEALFILVAAVVRFLVPSARHFIICSYEVTSSSRAPETNTSPAGVSRIDTFEVFVPSKRSLISSP
mmetsp:Transcript_33958/g.46579  ORF Transcript_33958/g.46579 Transcript_33958/m.46579 type:complete len:213 (-) Transcript_33958:264-902(-)